MNTYTDTRYTPDVAFHVIGDVIPVYIAPSESPASCEIGCGECFSRLSRDELRAFAEEILRTLDAS